LLGVLAYTSDELMLHGFVRLQSTFGIPSQTSRDEVEESFIVAFEGLLQCLGAGPTPSAFRRNSDSGLAQRIKEQLLPAALLDQMLFRRSKNFHDTRKLLLLVLSWEDGVASKQFAENAPQTPHVDG
jgi:hypothetical protein